MKTHKGLPKLSNLSNTKSRGQYNQKKGIGKIIQIHSCWYYSKNTSFEGYIRFASKHPETLNEQSQLATSIEDLDKQASSNMTENGF